jgi:hypothetical protein
MAAAKPADAARNKAARREKRLFVKTCGTD